MGEGYLFDEIFDTAGFTTRCSAVEFMPEQFREDTQAEQVILPVHSREGAAP